MLGIGREVFITAAKFEEVEDGVAVAVCGGARRKWAVGVGQCAAAEAVGGVDAREDVLGGEAEEEGCVQAQAAALEYSVAGRIGKALEPVTRPLGFDWRANTAMLGAVAAKEVFVAQLGIVHSLAATAAGPGAPGLEVALRRSYTPLQGIVIMLFCLLGLPCGATVAVMRSESGSWRWTLLQWGGLTALAYALAFIVYQVGSLAGWGGMR